MHSLYECIPNKSKTFVYHLYNVGPTSKTLGRRCINVIQMFCVYWVAYIVLCWFMSRLCWLDLKQIDSVHYVYMWVKFVVRQASETVVQPQPNSGSVVHRVCWVVNCWHVYLMIVLVCMRAICYMGRSFLVRLMNILVVFDYRAPV